jgi:LPXTG-motif cell wall-anchored protein
MAKFDYDDVYDLEVKRRRANREIDSGFENFLGFIGFLILIGIIAFFTWLHGSIAKITGPEAATWIVWLGVLCAAGAVVWIWLKRRADRARADRRRAAEEERYAALGRQRAQEVVRRAKAGQPGLLAEYWSKEGQRHGDADLMDFEAAQELVIEVYNGWTMIALDEQGHQRLLEDDVCNVFGTHRGMQIADGAWSLLDE